MESFRSLYNEVNGIEYNAIDGFEEAKTIDNACMILEGDYGGQIYLTCPMKYVKCSENTILGLLESIDKIEWDDSEGTGVFFEIVPIGQGVAGGMGGGAVIDGIWLHENLIKVGLKEKIEQIIAGERSLLTADEVMDV